MIIKIIHTDSVQHLSTHAQQLVDSEQRIDANLGLGGLFGLVHGLSSLLGRHGRI